MRKKHVNGTAIGVLLPMSSHLHSRASSSTNMSSIPTSTPSLSISADHISSALDADPFTNEVNSLSHVLGVSSISALEDKYFRYEKPRHLHYMFHFRVQPCQLASARSVVATPASNASLLSTATSAAAINGSPFASFPSATSTSSSSLLPPAASAVSPSLCTASDCFDYHSFKLRRRVPRIIHYSNGVFWNYNACRCQALEKEMKCDKGDACRYSHCKEEIAYHPSRYKTQPCSYPARPDGVCTRFGAHCAYAHGEEELRKPIVLKQGMPHKLIEQQQQQATASNNHHMNANQHSHLLYTAAALTPSTSAAESFGCGMPLSRRGSLQSLFDAEMIGRSSSNISSR